MKQDKQAPICMAKEFWINSQLSVARYYGGIRAFGHEYLILDTVSADLVRKDFVSYYRKLKRDRFIEVLERNQQTPEKELKEIFKAMTKKKRKDKDSKQLNIF